MSKLEAVTIKVDDTSTSDFIVYTDSWRSKGIAKMSLDFIGMGACSVFIT